MLYIIFALWLNEDKKLRNFYRDVWLYARGKLSFITKIGLIRVVEG